MVFSAVKGYIRFFFFQCHPHHNSNYANAANYSNTFGLYIWSVVSSKVEVDWDLQVIRCCCLAATV